MSQLYDSESDSESSPAYVQDSDAEHYIYYYGLNIQLVHETPNNEQSYLGPNEQDEEISHVTYQHSSDLQSQQSEDFFRHDNTNIGRQIATSQVIAGLPQEVIAQIPKMAWKLQNKKMNSDQKCAICLNCYQVNQNLRVLTCLHRFHVDCLDEWLRSRGNCPSCRHFICNSC